MIGVAANSISVVGCYSNVVYFDIFGSSDGVKYTIVFNFGSLQIQLLKNDTVLKTWQ